MLTCLGHDKLSLHEHILFYILVGFSGSVSILQWYNYFIRIKFSTSHFNNYQLPEYKERGPSKETGLWNWQITSICDYNFYSPRHIKIQLSLGKMLFRITAVHRAWTCISGLECKWTTVCIMSLASQTANMLTSNQSNEMGGGSHWIFSVWFKYVLQQHKVIQILWNAIFHVKYL